QLPRRNWVCARGPAVGGSAGPRRGRLVPACARCRAALGVTGRAMQQPTSPYVFLSYTSTERDRALAVADALQQAGITVWVDRQAILCAASWSAAIVRAIKN